MDIKLELRVQALEQAQKQSKCDIAWLKEKVKELGERNKEYLAELKKRKDPATQARTMKAKAREAKKLVNELEKAAKIKQ
jgi:hypothetical protein